MFICFYRCIYICIYVYIGMYVYVYLYWLAYVSLWMSLYVYMYVHVYDIFLLFLTIDVWLHHCLLDAVYHFLGHWLSTGRLWPVP